MASAAINPPKSAIGYYYGSIAFTAIALVAGFLLGGWQGAFIVAVLAVLETSLSFDNAVVNAKILKNWDHRWQQIFLTWGIWIAVFGMRIVFPLAIVTATTGIGPVEVTMMALNQPDEYARNLTAVHHQIAGFGGAFLAMVALSFFFEEKDTHWLGWIEEKLSKAGQVDMISAAIALLSVLLFSKVVAANLGAEKGQEFLVAGVWGIVSFILAHGLGALFGAADEDDEDMVDVDAATSAAPPSGKIAGTVVKAGLAGFLYLEMLDASFSFDGVIGAFALTNYLPIIALGLGVGAMFVRSMTIHLVRTGVMGQYRYLEHGAFYAIVALWFLLFASGAGYHMPEWFTGLIGGALIVAALVHSIIANKRDASAA